MFCCPSTWADELQQEVQWRETPSLSEFRFFTDYVCPAECQKNHRKEKLSSFEIRWILMFSTLKFLCRDIPGAPYACPTPRCNDDCVNFGLVTTWSHLRRRMLSEHRVIIWRWSLGSSGQRGCRILWMWEVELYLETVTSDVGRGRTLSTPHRNLQALDPTHNYSHFFSCRIFHM